MENWGSSPKLPAKIIDITPPSVAQPTADYGMAWSGNYSPVYVMPYNGEKNLGEMGPIRKYLVDHNALRLRSWQLMLESEIVQTIIKSYVKWTVGSGLKLQCEPKKDVLASEKITVDTETFNKQVEARWTLYANNSMSDASDMNSLNTIAWEALNNAMVGGDCLVNINIVDGIPKIQIIDGEHIQTPPTMVGGTANGVFDFTTESGNRVRWGVEIDDKGKHIAYYVRTGNGIDFKRIQARGAKTGNLMAFMVYGTKYRIDNVRGIPLVAAVMETAKTLERYKEAMVGGAEERAKVPYTFVHGTQSDQEDPTLKRRALASAGFGYAAMNDLPVDVNYNQVANQVMATTNKQLINLPNDVTIQAIESTQEIHFKEFYETNIDLVCAAVGIPPEVAMSKYESNYSASRAAIKAWEHNLLIERKKFAMQFYQPIYNLFLDMQINTLKIDVPGYMTAKAQRNVMAVTAYQNARWVGANVPHIDPMKEIQAVRAALGKDSENFPLTTFEAATEHLNLGDYNSNVEQYAVEITKGEGLQIKKVEPRGEVIEGADGVEANGTTTTPPAKTKSKAKPKTKK